MPSCYVKVRLDRWERGLVFPPLCPYTLDRDSSRMWNIRKRVRLRNRGVDSVAGLTINPAGQAFKVLRIPVSRKYAIRQECIGLVLFAAWVFIGLIFLLSILFSPQVTPPAFGTIAFVCCLLIVGLSPLRVGMNRHVRIHDLEPDFVVLAFTRRPYAEQFCALNGLSLRPER